MNVDPLDARARPGLHGVPFECPHDHGPLRQQESGLLCEQCGRHYPFVGGVPVLINEESSVFAIADYTDGPGYEGASYGQASERASPLRRGWRRFARALSDSPTSLRYPGPGDAIAYVAREHPNPRVLVIGSGGLQVGDAGSRVVHTDVALGPEIAAIADAHDLPFPDASFDLVIAVAVLEHVADPFRCVAEMRRVLAPAGHVYAVTPFLQPVHMGAYDFTRFTPIGHRRLFRHFDEVGAGLAMGAGSVAAYTLKGFLLSLSNRKPWRYFAQALCLFCSPPLRKLDRWLPHSADAAGCCWFFGRQRDGDPVSDRDLIASYREDFGARAAKSGRQAQLGA